MLELTKRLVEAYGPSGFEDNIRALIEVEVAPFSDEMSVDAMGNLIARKEGDGSGLKVMIAAHMDEIGLMVTHITETSPGAVFVYYQKAIARYYLSIDWHASIFDQRV